MKKQKELDRLTKELVKQMTGNEVEDPQEGDYQIAYYYLSKAMDYTHSCTELPSMEAANTEIVDSLGILKTMKNSPCKEANYDEAYVTGFANCYNWIRDKAIT